MSNYSKSKKGSGYLKAASFFIFSFFLMAAHAQDDVMMIVKGQTVTNAGKSALAGSLGARTAKTNEEPVEGVDIEVKKDGATIAKITSGKKGKYTFQIPVSTDDIKNDYVVYISKDGFVPKMININAYLSKNEYAKYPFTKYDFEMDLTLLKTTIKDIVLDKPSAKVSWDVVKEHKFDFDRVYYTKVIQKEEAKMIPNPDAYFKNLAKKKKKAEELLAKNKAAADAKAKAEEEAKKKIAEEAQKLAALKAKEEADRILKENLEAMKQELAKKRTADSLAEIERRKTLEASGVKLEIKKIVKPVGADVDANQYDATEMYSINIAKQSLSAEKARRNKEKGRNLTMKYETLNTLTSLLNVVDENDKRAKKQ